MKNARAGDTSQGADLHEDSIKVPAITVAFWIIKILATTFGETAGDAVSMSLDLGYLTSTVIFALAFMAFVVAQTRARSFHPYLYWSTIIATTTVGTTLADFLTRSVGIGYPGGALILMVMLGLTLYAWKRTLGSTSVTMVMSAPAEMYYWLTIMVSQTLGTALGDWTADTAGLGYSGSALVFGSALAIIAVAYYRTKIAHTALFWAAFILTRPLGAVIGDFLDKPIDHGGLALSRYTASAVIFVLIAGGIHFFSRRPALRQH
ncbi:MAG: hypothetical protein NTX15_02280 [Candidatus Kapabacteria bacterium]|nr:hypothetical protein [Candidatus Kapabacteria bacterium]